MAYIDYCSELVGTIPRLPFPLAQKLINRAWRDIRDTRLWSFLIGTADILTTNNVTTGTITATPGESNIQLDAAAKAALQPLSLANPPLASAALGQGRQIRIGMTGSGGPLYSIISLDWGLNFVTLDRPYVDPTGTVSGAGLPYQCYKAYFANPDVQNDFLRYVTITNMRAGYTIRGKKLYYTQQKLNAVDAQRGGSGDAYIVANYKVDNNGRPVHEWYPHPVNAAIYNCVYQKRGKDLSPNNDLPATLPDSVLMARAFMYAADWAAANVSTYPDLQLTNWVMFRESKKEEYKETLLQAIKQDDEIFPQAPFLQGSYFDFPLGGQFLQGHDVSSLIGDAT